MPSPTMTIPPMAGPIICARLNWIELRATALGRCGRGTRDGTSDWKAGPPNAWARPDRNDSARM